MLKKESKATENGLKELKSLLEERRTVKFKDGKFKGLKPRETRFLKSVCEMYREVRRGMDIFKSPQQIKKVGGPRSFFGISRETKDGEILFGSTGHWVTFVKKGIEEINKHKWYPTNEEIYEDMKNIFDIAFEHGTETVGGWFKPFINVGFEQDGYGYQTVFKIELNEEILKYF